MLSSMQKLSKDLIIYSVLVSDFEKPDFKNDALAGVRANYFNSNCFPQTDKTEIIIDNRLFSLSYSLKKGEVMSWKATSNHHPYQTVKRSSDAVYSVITYGSQGIVVKRQYFDAEHHWLRTEYYDGELENVHLASVASKLENGVQALKYEIFHSDGNKDAFTLYPSVNPPKRRCAALVYSNSGMIWFDASFKPQEPEASACEKKIGSGFDFRIENFQNLSSSPLDLKNAAYLSEDDIKDVEPETAFSEEEKPYSAYDRIEEILYEAHKTNKNIFGEVVSHSGEETDEAEPKEENAQEVVEFELTEPGAPDAEITSKNGVYSYYGQLDENGGRTGRGRIVAPDGITVYDGEYTNDKRSGFGICYYKDGSPNYAGEWSMGARSGRGVGYRASDGTMHVGKWMDNAPNGIGARFDADGELVDICRYSDGIRDGKSVSFDENGDVVIRIWDNGELISEKIITDGE